MNKIRVLLIDNYDSFTYNLYDYFLQLGTTCEVIRNDDPSLDDFQQLEFDALVLSPGPGKPSDAGSLMSMIEYFYDKKPILGICLGHQGIGEFFGATLKKATLPIHGKTSVLQHQGHELFKGLPETFHVMRYHSLIIEDLENTSLDIIAQTSEGEVMAAAHRELPLIGLQFHPESILTEHGLRVLGNWLERIRRTSAV